MAIKPIFKRFWDNAKLFLLPCEENDFRARIFSGNFLFFFFVTAIMLKLGFAIFLYSFSNNQFYADITKTSLVELANGERARHSLPPLTENSVLDNAAYMKALDMARNGYFNHFSPTGISPWHWFDQAGYNYKYAGENLAIGFLESNEVQDAWAASPTHEANIINDKYKEVGIAVLKANFQGNPATIVVQLFGSKLAKSQANKNTQTSSLQTPAKSAGDGQPTQNELAGGLENKNVLGASTVAGPDENSAGYKLASFFAKEYFGLIQSIIYGVLVFVILLLLINFALKADFDHADLLAKALGFVMVMGVFTLIDQNLVAALIPHTLLIQ